MLRSPAIAVLLLTACAEEPTPPTGLASDLPRPALCDALLTSFEAPEPRWEGDVEHCEPGPPDHDANHAAVDRINLVREHVGLPPVRLLDPTDALGCALLLDANDALSHEPPATWHCADDARRATAARSLLASAGSLDLVQGFLIDPGNEDSLGHRRWLLSGWLSGAAFASTPDYTCVDLAAEGTSSLPWVAWPPPGDTPAELHRLLDYDVDDVGWSIQSDSLDLTVEGLLVRFRRGDEEETLVPNVLPAGYGSTHAIHFRPTRPVPEGVEWQVELLGLPTPIRYTGRRIPCLMDDR